MPCGGAVRPPHDVLVGSRVVDAVRPRDGADEEHIARNVLVIGRSLPERLPAAVATFRSRWRRPREISLTARMFLLVLIAVLPAIGI